jgi:hypothetical protein
MEPSDALDVLHAFRDRLYECFDRRADALFELTDSILTAGVVPSPVHLSLEAVHRRGWGSLVREGPSDLLRRFSAGTQAVVG